MNIIVLGTQKTHKNLINLTILILLIYEKFNFMGINKVST